MWEYYRVDDFVANTKLNQFEDNPRNRILLIQFAEWSDPYLHPSEALSKHIRNGDMKAARNEAALVCQTIEQEEDPITYEYGLPWARQWFRVLDDSLCFKEFIQTVAKIARGYAINAGDSECCREHGTKRDQRGTYEEVTAWRQEHNSSLFSKQCMASFNALSKAFAEQQEYLDRLLSTARD